MFLPGEIGDGCRAARRREIDEIGAAHGREIAKGSGRGWLTSSGSSRLMKLDGLGLLALAMMGVVVVVVVVDAGDGLQWKN